MLTGMYDNIYGGVCDDSKPWKRDPSSDAWQKGEAYDLWWRDYEAHCNSKPRWHFDEFQHAFLTIFQVTTRLLTHYLLPLLTTYYLLPTTHYLLFTTYYYHYFLLPRGPPGDDMRQP